MRHLLALCLCCCPLITNDALARGEKLYGVHWWDYSRPNTGSGPTDGWSVETVITNSDAWWQGWWFQQLYQQVTSVHNAEIITRIDYNWGQTVPSPSTISAQQWANTIMSDVIGPLGPYAHRWVIGNEPNIVGEGNGWASNQITPEGYAEIYHTVRQAIKAQRPNDEVLFAPVSPGGVIPGVRWKGGNQWLAEAIDAALAFPGGAIDGFALHAYGNPFTGATQAVTEFHSTYVSQLGVIDSKSLNDVPVYITEWNRATATTGNLAANEQVSADFLRLSLIDVDNWNRVPGNHNIRSLAWFIHNKDYGDAWNQYSLEWWGSQGNPAGHPGDLWTSLVSSSELLAGVIGTRPITDYNSDGSVNEGDYDSWSTNFGRGNWVYADGNRNGRVDAADYVLWRKSVFSVSEATSMQVPEIAAIPYVVIAVCSVAICHRVMRRRHFAGILMLICSVLLVGCSGKPRRVSVADVDPADAASSALAAYDSDGDGKLSDQELRSAPGILKCKSLYDLDGDGFVSETEISDRIAKCQADKIGFRAVSARVTLDGRPLPNVTVTLTPEPYLGDAIKAASGVTNPFGNANLTVTPEDLPEVIQARGITITGIYPGTYKITLSHPQRKLPEVFTDGAPLGAEVAADTVDSSIDIELVSR